MKLKAVFVSLLFFSLGLYPLLAQGKRIAITVNNKGKFPEQQSRIADAITSLLAGRSGLAIIDNDQVEQILKQQNQQNSDRYSPESAVRIGKLIGASVLVVVQVEDFSSTSSVKRSFGAAKTIGNVMLQANVRMTNTETGVILAQPSASFHNSATLSETSNNVGVSILSGGKVNPSSTQGDVQAETKNLNNSAIEAVAGELAGKIEAAAGASKSSSASSGGSVVAAQGESALVAGIYDGAVYINKGSSAGVKIGDHFQIIRTVELPPIDPATGKHLTSKKTICTLVTKTVDEGNASGSCDGGIPQTGDTAQTQPR